MKTIREEVTGRSAGDCRTDPNQDILWGPGAIGQVIGRSERATFHMLESGHLPARKVGRLWSASRRRLLAHLAGDEGGAA